MPSTATTPGTGCGQLCGEGDDDATTSSSEEDDIPVSTVGSGSTASSANSDGAGWHRLGEEGRYASCTDPACLLYGSHSKNSKAQPEGEGSKPQIPAVLWVAVFGRRQTVPIPSLASNWACFSWGRNLVWSIRFLIMK